MKKILFLWGFIFTNVCHSQTGMWTWMKGDSTNSAGIYGTRGISSINNMPAARVASVNWTDLLGNFWLFGGASSANNSINNNNKNDLWKYTKANNQWTWMKGDSIAGNRGVYGIKGVSSINNKPGCRFYSMSWCDKNNNLWLFGGQSQEPTSSGYDNNDLWKYNATLNQWVWLHGDSLTTAGPSIYGVYGTKGIASAANKPWPRNNGITWTDNNGDLWLFGGSANFASIVGAVQLNDLWKYSISTNSWAWIKGDSVPNIFGSYGNKKVSSATNNPGARLGSISWIDAANNLWLFGGGGYGTNGHSGDMNDLWKYTISTNEWTWISGDSIVNSNGNYGNQGIEAATNKPGSRQLALNWTDHVGNFWLFGGDGYDSQHNYFGPLNDLWKYNINTDKWVWVSGDNKSYPIGVFGTRGIASPSNIPRGRFSSISWTDANNDLWLFSGVGYAKPDYVYSNDLWKFSLQNTIPVHIITFTAQLQGDQTTHLQWTAEKEQNFDHYEVERSTDSKEFVPVKIQKAKGNNGSKQTYNYDDPVNNQLPSVKSFYYRLKMVDKNGSFTYSNIITITRNQKLETFSIYPNPATTSVQLQFSKTLHGQASVEVSNMDGKVVMKKVFGVDGNTITLSNILPSGTYSVKVITTDETFIQKMFVQ